MTATADAFDQVLWVFRMDNPSYYARFSSEDFQETIRLSAETPSKRREGKNPLSATATKVNREMKRNRRPKSFIDDLRKILASALLEAAAYRYPKDQAPKVHHWVPICYLSNFTRGLEQKSGRGALIPMMDYSKDPKENVIIRDKEFAHPIVAGEGFFQLSAERFFSILESRYCNALLRLQEGEDCYRTHLLSYVSMLLVQHLRAPIQGEFRLKTLEDFSRELERLLESFDEGYAYLEFSELPLPFTVDTPTRERHFPGGGKAWYFPLTSSAALIFSSRELSEADRSRMVEGSRIATAKEAKGKGAKLFGAIGTDFE